MKIRVFLICLCSMLTIRAQGIAPESMANTIVKISPSTGGVNFPAYSMLFSSNGISYILGSTDGILRSNNAYTWTKTSETTGVLGFGAGPSQLKTVVTFFLDASRGSYEGSLGTGGMLFSPFKIMTEAPLRNMSSLITLAQSQPTAVGFVVGGSVPRQVVVRAVGPALAQFGVVSFATNPSLRVLRKTTVVAVNSGWNGSAVLAKAFAAVGAFELPISSKDAALLLSLSAGEYTAQVQADGGGNVLVEIYFVD